MIEIDKFAIIVAILTGSLSILSGIVAYFVNMNKRFSRIERSLKINEVQRKYRKKETAMLFRYLISLHDGMKKCGFVNGDMDQYRGMVIRYIDEQMSGSETWEGMND